MQDFPSLKPSVGSTNVSASGEEGVWLIRRGSSSLGGVWLIRCCRSPSPSSMLATKLNMSPDSAERWIVNLIRNAKLDAKIDAKEVQKCPIGIEECSFVTRGCPFGTRECPFGTRECPFGTRECPFGTRECPFGVRGVFYRVAIWCRGSVLLRVHLNSLASV